MSSSNKIRLNKVIKEFNISLERVVSFLSDKGHEIEARPTTKISQNQYDLLLNEFSLDRSSKVESHDLSEEKKKEKEEIRIKFEKEKELKFQNQTITSKSSIPRFKKVGEINLNKPTVKQNPKTETKQISSEDFVLKDKKIETKYEKLSGIKETGKTIDLEKFNKNDSNQNTQIKSKRKRRRIAKDLSLIHI